MPLCVLVLSLLLAGCAPAQTPAPSPPAPRESTVEREVVRAPVPSPTKTKKDVPYVPTPHETVEAMLDLARVTKDDVVYDLGSGDGRIVLAAARRGARATGVDLDAHLVDLARDSARQEGLQERATFHHGDIFETDLREATVVTMYLLPDVNLKLKPKLLQELRPGTRVVSHSFDMGDWKPDREVIHEGRELYLWTIPAKG